jgi:signal transduction histidine kinase
MAVARTRTQGAEKLRPRARILRTFGDELISSEKVAVIELVKNSYDADATRVLVRFHEPLERGKGSIEVIDDGHGMSTDVVRTAWMEPATLYRAQERRSEVLGRRVLGEKGVGRFAASRLADRLMLVTRRPGSAHETLAYFDWTQFDDPDLYLADVDVLWEEQAASELTLNGALGALDALDPRAINDGQHGTVLRMEELRTDWRRERFAELRTALSRLVSPFADRADAGGPGTDFQIALDVPAPDDDLSGPIGPPDALRDPHYYLAGNIDERGRCQFRRRIGPEGPEEKIEIELRPRDRRLPTCGPLTIELRVWDREASSLREVAQQYGLKLRDFRRELDDLAGVSVYRDGFRVFPYGERGDDWLGLDARRVQQPTLRLSNNQIAGYVAISRETNPHLRDQTNREGLMQNREFEDLRDLVLGALQLIEEPRWRQRRADRERRDPGSDSGRPDVFDAFDLDDLRGTVQEKHGPDPDIDDAFDEKQRNVEAGVGEVRELLGGYSRLASLGRLVDAILHDGRAPLAAIDSDAKLALRRIERAKRSDDPIVQESEKRLLRIRGQAAVLGALFARIRPFAGRRRGRPKKLIIEEIIRDTFELETTRMEGLGAKVRLPRTETEVTVEETDLRIVVWNLLDNALYWLSDVAEGEREIAVRVRRLRSGELEILFSDSGPGVPEEDRELIFEPYVSRKVNGWGIGLAQAGDIVHEYYDGTLTLVDAGPLGGATFRVLLRRRV